MDLQLNRSLGAKYKSAMQKARVVTESWTEQNAYCCSCGGTLVREAANARVLDFRCTQCDGNFELKSTRRRFGRTVPDGAYASMIARLQDNSSPDFLFLCYDPKSLFITDLFAVPTHFLDRTTIKKRRPLAPHARRAGWVGCNIDMGRIPQVGKVYCVRERQITDRSLVLAAWQRTLCIRHEPSLKARSWTLEILRIIQSVETEYLTLHDLYGFESRLRKRFPQNHNIRAKIRQQVQVLRDANMIEFLGRGKYRVIGNATV